eukprot:360737-Chlamydomonas_euryale.AAC.5
MRECTSASQDWKRLRRSSGINRTGLFPPQLSFAFFSDLNFCSGSPLKPLPPAESSTHPQLNAPAVGHLSAAKSSQSSRSHRCGHRCIFQLAKIVFGVEVCLQESTLLDITDC